MAIQGEDLDDAFPHGLARKDILDRLGSQVRRLDAMQIADGLPQPFALIHATLLPSREPCAKTKRPRGLHPGASLTAGRCGSA